jgi:hypothetical protein
MKKSKRMAPIAPIGLRWNMPVEWNRPRRYSILGLAESGKSALNEYLAHFHPKIIDIFGSRDNENLCWLRESSPVENPLLVCGDNTDIDSKWPYKHVSELTIQDIDGHDATITCDAFYSDQDTKFQDIQRICDLLYQRKSWDKEGGDIIYLVIREAMSLLYSKVSLGVGEKEAKAAILTFLRELRHFGVSFGADSLRWTGIEKEIRDLADYTFFKQIGEVGLPKDKRYIYNYVEPKTFAHMKPWESIVLHKTGALAYVATPLPPWHKQEGINLLQELEIIITNRAVIIEDGPTKIGDREHEQIVREYSKTLSMQTVSDLVHRSKSTISQVVQKHNRTVEKLGQCDACSRIGSDLAGTTIRKRPDLAP